MVVAAVPWGLIAWGYVMGAGMAFGGLICVVLPLACVASFLIAVRGAALSATNSLVTLWAVALNVLVWILIAVALFAPA